jgi:acyl carrier protein
MEEQQIFQKLESMLRDNRYIPSDKKITPEIKFRAELGMDSLDVYEFAYSVEEEFCVDIPDEKANQFETVGDYIKHIKDYQEKSLRTV